MTRRNIELLLLSIASIIFLLLFGTLVITSGLGLSIQTLGVPIGVIVAFIVSHIAIRKLAPAADPAILPIVLVLVGIGITFITRLAPDLALRQVMWLFAGVVCMVLTLVIVRVLHKVQNYKFTLMIVGVVLLLSPMLPIIGKEIYGSRIWLSIGPFSFQPGEVAKVAVVLFLASYLAQNREMLSVFTKQIGPFKFPELRTLFPLLIMWALSLLIVIFEKDLGSAVVFFVVFLVMIYVCTGKKFYPVIGLILAVIAGVFLLMFFSHVQVRVDTWLDPFEDPTGSGYQLVQSLYSLADGGLFGTGLGKGLATQIPVVESDFIFVAISEELGLMGGAAVLLLFLCFAIRGYVTAARAKNDVSSFVAVGLTTTIILQAFIIVGGVTKLIPLTGLTLPFISQGGSSLLASFIIVGFLLRAGDEGTGIENDLKAANIMLSNGVLGRVSLGKRITACMIMFSIMFAILVGNLTYIMVFQADSIQHMSSNNHVMLREQYNKRGNIETSDGTVLAKSVKQEDGTYSRTYPQGSLAAHVVGYASTKYGTLDIEQSWNDALNGKENFASWTDVLNDMMGKNNVGNDVTLTLDTDVQKAAEAALVGRKGACVVMDSTTGGIMAMASSPTYNINDVEDILSGKNASYDASAMYNRATNLYAPGSTFKALTLSAALQEGVINESDKFDAPGTMELGGGTITNFKKTAYGNITVARGTEVSSNTLFAQVGEKLGATNLVKYAERYMFNHVVNFDIPLSASLMPNPEEMTLWETGWASAGVPVGEHNSPAGPQVTCLEMAMVASTICNHGVMNQPYLVQKVSNPSGEIGYQANTTMLATPISEETAKRTAAVLEGVVKRGTGTAAAINGVTIAGKTGTAEKGGDKDDSWFIGFSNTAEGGGPVIAIVLEDSHDAAAKSNNVLKTALQKAGKLK